MSQFKKPKVEHVEESKTHMLICCPSLPTLRRETTSTHSYNKLSRNPNT